MPHISDREYPPGFLVPPDPAFTSTSSSLPSTSASSVSTAPSSLSDDACREDIEDTSKPVETPRLDIESIQRPNGNSINITFSLSKATSSSPFALGVNAHTSPDESPPEISHSGHSDEGDTDSEVSEPEEPVPPRPYCKNPFQFCPSPAAEEWEKRKAARGEVNEVIDRLMRYQGLEEVKQQFLDIKSKVDICESQGRSLNRERFNVVFQGNPGTGKTTFARLYAEFLHSVGVINSSYFKETAGIALAVKGAEGAQDEVEDILNHNGGVLFIDEAYQLTAAYIEALGKQALDFLLKAMEDNIGKLVVVFVGYKEEMESFFEHNPGLTSRIPWTMHFADFTDAELWEILYDNIHVGYRGNMRVDGGMDGKPMRIAVRRLAQSRGNRGFGNARAVENLIGQISSRQARRLQKLRVQGKEPDCNFFTQEDVIGPDPSDVLQSSHAWNELQKLIGLDTVKKNVRTMMGMIQKNYRRELKEIKPFQLPLNQLFLGPPGTGKTTVAKLYGQILNDLGLLTRGDLIVKNPADFIGECLGKSEAKTRKILEATVGRVLVIDEAYMLDPGDPNKEQDKFKTGVLDTLVSIIQGVPGEDRCIIFVGYEDRIRNMFHNANPGLSRRFRVDRPFRFQNFTINQLLQVMQLKMEQKDLSCTPEAWEVARDVLERALMRPNFGNAGDVDNCLAAAQMNFEQRQSAKPLHEQACDDDLQPQDFDPDWDRISRGATDCQRLLSGKVHQNIIDKFVNYQKRCLGARKYGFRPRDLVPTNFVFAGPAGTGKSTAACQMGRIFYNMGLLSAPEVVEHSASDLIGQYVGQTSPKTRKLLELASGKVLFIDEVHRLASGQFAAEAVDELVGFLTQQENAGKMVVILAGYQSDIRNLMSNRPDLSGLFKEEIAFDELSPEDCVAILLRELDANRITTESDFLRVRESRGHSNVRKLFKALIALPGWSNARDVKYLATQILGNFLESAADNTTSDRTLSADHVEACIMDMITLSTNRCKKLGDDGNTALPISPPHANNDPEPATLEETQASPPPPRIDPAICTPGGDTACDVDVNVNTQHKPDREHQPGLSKSKQRERDDEPVPNQRRSQHTNDTDAQSSDETHVSIPRALQRQQSPKVEQHEKQEPSSRPQSLHNSEELEHQASLSEHQVPVEATWEQRKRRATQVQLQTGVTKINTKTNSGTHTLVLRARRWLSRLLKRGRKREKQETRVSSHPGRCEAGYAWNAVPGGYRCEGRHHFMPAS
ncbi:stage V sporulation protein K [Coccidioides immitis H538.4]|uniref:Stage V sporulation protein K n=1 Tax=Coccidioides immitis H538.4 TaxID=396776 RepID=A0A0J8RYV0_COCIT|nr:stage V sporulation protein K [Coccidioides immitis H538.4]